VNIVRTYKFKLYRSKKNKHLHRQIDIAGLVYNHCIARHRRYYRLSGKRLSRYDLMRHITRLKKRPRSAYWNLVGSQAIQDVVRPRWRGARIDKAYNLFFGNLKRKVKTSPPGFKKVKKYSFVVAENISQSNQTMTGNSAGFDFGLETFLTASDGQKIASPLYYRQAMAELKQAQQNLARVVCLIDRFYPSSKSCSDSGEINHRLTLADRRWVCAGCGSVHDRDDNAAKNIQRVGASTLGLGDVRTPLAAVPV
jgi:putative transposase